MILLHGYNRPMEDDVQRAIRDLKWCLGSPGLVTAGDPAYLWPDDQFFSTLLATSQFTGSQHTPPPRPPANHHFRLGQHFEQLLLYWLGHQTRYELVDANLQVNDHHRTVGEFDLLVRLAGEIQHWEAAVKFYLGRGDTTDPAHWFGPNTSDRFDIKYARLVRHQLCLSRHPVASDALARRGIGVTSSLCFMKGRLFYPHEDYFGGSPRSNPAAPHFVNPNHLQGWWLETENFGDKMDPAARYVHLEKRDWLAPLICGGGNGEANSECNGEGNGEGDGMSHADMQAYLDDGREPATHVAVLDKTGTETSRGFVVDQRWLQSTESARRG